MTKIKFGDLKLNNKINEWIIIICIIQYNIIILTWCIDAMYI